MSLLTTWTTTSVPHVGPLPDTREAYETGVLRGPWDCLNCDLLNPGGRRRCADCGTRREQPAGRQANSARTAAPCSSSAGAGGRTSGSG